MRFPSPFLEASSRPLLRTSVFTLVFLCVHCGLPNLALGQQEDETAAPVPPPEDDPPKGAETPDDSSPTGERKEESGEEQVDVTAQDEAEGSSDEVIESANRPADKGPSDRGGPEQESDESAASGQVAPTASILGEAQETPPDGEGDALPEDDASSEGDAFLEDDELEYGAVAEVEAPPREPTKRTLEAEQLTRIAGTRGDALRAIEVMPGVARTPFASTDGPPVLRGSSSEDSLVLIDGASIPLLYHFGGLTSVFNSHLLERVDLYPGNYSARYGRASGGVVEARVRDPRTDKFHAMLELSAIDSFALVESPIGKKTSVALAARRSNIDFFFDALLPEDAFNVLAAPVYYDYQAIVSHRFDQNHQLRALAYGSHDRLELFLSDAAADDPALRGKIDARSQFHRLQLELNSKFSEMVTQQLMVSAGPSLQKQVLGDLDAQFSFLDVNARAEWSIFAHRTLRIDTGLDFWMFAGRGRYVGPAPVADEGNPLSDTLAGENYITIEPESVYPVRPAAYIEASYRPFEQWLIVPGVRADYVSDGADWTVDPRLSTRVTVHEGTTLKGGVGLYSQPPEYFQNMPELGNPEIKPFRTLQTTFGVEQRIVSGVSADVEGFYKHWYDRLIGTEGGEPPRFLNEGTGRAYGMEVLLDVRPTARIQALAAYTLARSERKDGNAASWRLFDYDQTHNLSLTANYDFGKGWMLGARFRYVTGSPTTPITAAVYDASTDTYRGIYGPSNSDRLPSFHQLDIRGEKRWDIGPVGLTLYLEVMNVYNRKNVEGMSYSFDYSERERAVGMPIFPNLGIRGEL